MLKRREGFGIARAVVLSAAALGVLIPACASDKMGTVGEDCYPNGTCNETLVCKAGKCVADTGGNGGAGGQGTTSSSSSSASTTATTGSSTTSSTSGTGGGTTSSSSSTSSSSGTGGGTTSSSSTSSSSTTSSGTTANAPPQILVLGTNVPSITEGEAVTFTAVVTDPDGIDDVIGGTLSDGNGHFYGAFATTGQEGAYQMIVSWGQINQVQDIDLATATPASRSFVAEFFDQAGHTVQKSIAVSLDCKMLGACNGHCMDLTNDVKNCGACGNQCPAGAVCYQGHCPVFTNCTTPMGLTCNQICANQGKTCADKCGPNNTAGSTAYTAGSCTGTSGNNLCVSPTSNIVSIKCCCF